MKIFYEKKEHFLKDFFKFVQINKDENYKKIDKTVEKIIRQVKLKGDKALIDLTKKNSVKVIYIIYPIDNSIIYNYFNKDCLKEVKISKFLSSYELKEGCN